MSNKIKTKIDQSLITYKWKDNTPKVFTQNVSALIKDNKLILRGALPKELPVSSAQMEFLYNSIYCVSGANLEINFECIPMVLDALSSIELEYTPGQSFEYNIIEKAEISYKLKDDLNQ